ncbi:Temptin [Phytophthora ramorum]|uniref:Temptin Cys/Cys disulfide domain-containing protein n=1 Tax=Phytophthora ramorum TaxID=164328 RepID=H3GT10_PHYRM|nr:Temptin [Phytophthora ramorum]
MKITTVSTAQLATALALAALLASEADASKKFVKMLPNGGNVPDTPAIGHPDGTGKSAATNAFGDAFSEAGNKWTKELCEADTDGDGQTNGQELGDPCCEWDMSTNPVVQWTTGVSHPDDASKTSDPTLWANLCGASTTESTTTTDSSATAASTGSEGASNGSGATSAPSETSETSETSTQSPATSSEGAAGSSSNTESGDSGSSHMHSASMSSSNSFNSSATGSTSTSGSSSSDVEVGSPSSSSESSRNTIRGTSSASSATPSASTPSTSSSSSSTSGASVAKPLFATAAGVFAVAMTFFA